MSFVEPTGFSSLIWNIRGSWHLFCIHVPCLQREARKKREEGYAEPQMCQVQLSIKTESVVAYLPGNLETTSKGKGQHLESSFWWTQNPSYIDVSFSFIMMQVWMVNWQTPFSWLHSTIPAEQKKTYIFPYIYFHHRGKNSFQVTFTWPFSQNSSKTL